MIQFRDNLWLHFTGSSRFKLAVTCVPSDFLWNFFRWILSSGRSIDGWLNDVCTPTSTVLHLKFGRSQNKSGLWQSSFIAQSSPMSGNILKLIIGKGKNR